MFSSLVRNLNRKGTSNYIRVSATPSQERPLLFRSSDQYENDTEAGARLRDGNAPLLEVSEELEDEEGEDEDDANEADPLLPLFSAAHLGWCNTPFSLAFIDRSFPDSLPVFNLTHNIRLLIVRKCETTLSWEQLRSPQISQFLVKPLQNEIRASHFSRATLFALIANCLQFRKEGQSNAAIVGVCTTRALVAELLAVRLLKEYTTRELIDALSYDFDPLGGEPQRPVNGLIGRGMGIRSQPVNRSSSAGRTSTLEVAIKAQAKKFLSHPLVVQHLEAIWAGSIVFHSAADNLHRYPTRPRMNHGRHYGATHTPEHDLRSGMRRTKTPIPPAPLETVRRSVTLYDPKNASLFKLSRLRVPRYRQLLSTASYGVMLGLFLAVLSQRSLAVTPMEILFWFWSAGFMLDELVGFSEQGFGLYIASVWNTFDLGILFLFTIYYILRISGTTFVTESYQDQAAHMAYDVLAASAVLLFPRLFNLLDHFRYFSQLLIAFRLMIHDLVAVLVLILICCSGFFVAFTMSFGQEDFSGRGVAYALFQIFMGFTPAAWEVWSDFNLLGQGIMIVFLVICHFLVVTILISVLTNSFMAIVKNANEEHQYLFAINTISAVKSDALFSYIAPTNCIGFLLAPLRYIMPFPKYVLLNRTVIKVTHFPLLWAIFAYERLSLAASGTEPVDQVEQRGRSVHRMPTFAMAGGSPSFTNTQRFRMPSEANYQKDRALDEVFKRPFDMSTVRKPRPSPSAKKSAVDQWMNIVGDHGGASPPAEQPRSILEHLEGGRPGLFRSHTSHASGLRARSMARSFTSDPDERRPSSGPRKPRTAADSDLLGMSIDEPVLADDELNSNDEEHEQATLQHGSDKENQRKRILRPRTPSIKFREQVAPSSVLRNRKLGSSPGPASSSPPVTSANLRRHNRESSTQTILFNPVPNESTASSPPHSPTRFDRRRTTRPGTALKTIPSAPTSPPIGKAQRPRDIPRGGSSLQMLPQQQTRNKSVPNLNTLLHDRGPSYDAVALDLASDIGDNRVNDPGAAFLSSSFQTQMMRGMDSMRRRQDADENSAMNRIMLARMNNLEQGFKDMLKEVKEWRSTGSRSVSTGEESTTARAAFKAAKRAERRTTQKNKISAQQLRETSGPSGLNQTVQQGPEESANTAGKGSTQNQQQHHMSEKSAPGGVAAI